MDARPPSPAADAGSPSAPGPAPADAALLGALAAALGPEGLVTDPEALAPWLTDWRGSRTGRALALVQPTGTAEVAEVVRLAARAGVAIVPQGGNSGMVAGATPDASGRALLLSLRRMNRVRAIDADAGTAVVEAGVVLADLHAAAAARGLRFPLTLGGKGVATVGGLVAANAGGTQVLRHGTMRALTLGLEAVLAGGAVHDGLAPLAKDNRGYDLRHLLVGSEGTLGVITAATVKLVPAVAERAVAWVGVAGPEPALALLRRLEGALGRALEGFELMPEEAVAGVLAHLPALRRPGPTAPWHVLIEVVAERAEGTLSALVADALAAAGPLVLDAALAPNERAADGMWAIRDAISLAERARGPALQHDVSVPVARMPGFITELAHAVPAAFPGATTLAFGHLGDGNVHYHVRPPQAPEDGAADPAAWVVEHGPAVARLVYGTAHGLGGSLSAEHGIGQTKVDLLRELSAPARIAALRGIKAGLDPDGLFNPGKLVP